MLRRLQRILLGVAIGLAIVAAGIWVLIHALGERDVLYQGKPFAYWLKQLDSPDPAVTTPARTVLDTQIIPRLTDTMFHDTNDSAFRLSFIDALNTLPGVQIYFTPADGRRAGAVNSLAEIGPPAKAALPDLLKALKSKDTAVRAPAARALGRLRSEPADMIPLLIACLDESRDDGVPAAAAEALGEFGPLSKAALPKLTALLKIPDKDLQAAIRGALKKIGPE